MFHSVAAKVWAHERVPFDTLHGDTAAAALFGAYTAPTPETLQIVHGYSKDHRPDLKSLFKKSGPLSERALGEPSAAVPTIL